MKFLTMLRIVFANLPRHLLAIGYQLDCQITILQR